MSEGVWTLGRVDADPAVSVADNFKRATSGTAAGTAGLVITANPGRFYRGVFENSAATAYFLQIHDKATAPVNTDVPIYEERLPVSGECKIDLVNINGLRCANGISIAVSSTAGTLTLAIANDLAFRSVIYTAKV